MRIDIHIHSSHSDCSSLEVGSICSLGVAERLPIITVTDHGNARGCMELESTCPGREVVYGVEITAEEGDFLVYSLDKDYVKQLKVYQESVMDLMRNEYTAIVWAHPRVPHHRSMGWASPQKRDEMIERAISNIDGIEVINGTMLSLAATGVVHMNYFVNLKELAKSAGLAMTGASDAHELQQLFTAWTEFDDNVKTPEDFIRSIKERRVAPGFDYTYYDINVPLE